MPFGSCLMTFNGFYVAIKISKSICVGGSHIFAPQDFVQGSLQKHSETIYMLILVQHVVNSSGSSLGYAGFQDVSRVFGS